MATQGVRRGDVGQAARAEGGQLLLDVDDVRAVAEGVQILELQLGVDGAERVRHQVHQREDAAEGPVEPPRGAAEVQRVAGLQA